MQRFTRILRLGESQRLAIVAILLLSFITLAQPAVRQTLRRHLPLAARNARSVGNMPANSRLTLAISLPLRNQDELHTLLQQIYDPASTNYHRYLTPEQFTEKFGPTKQDYEAVKAFAQTRGLKVSAEHRNRMLVEVNGSIGNIERAFHTTLRTYEHPTERRTFYAPDTAPSLDLAVPVLEISGLDNYSLPQPRVRPISSAAAQNASPNVGSGPFGSYAGYDFRAAYAPDTTLIGSGQIVGLLQFDGYDSNDIAYYESLAGLPSVTLSNVLLNGASGMPSGNGGEVEVSLDIEMAIAMAPGLAKVIVYEAPNPTPFEIILNQMAEDNLASQLSCSWFIPHGAASETADAIFQQMLAQGQSFFNATGDLDAFSGLIDFPSDNPYITQVGGTMLTTTSAGGPLVSETVWNRNNGTGSGGGISTQYAIPFWQTNIDMTACQGSTTMRNIPDVAIVAENIYVRVNGSDHFVGGTSASAPLWAGFAALVNQQAANIAQPRVGFFNPLLSRLAASPRYLSLFNDVTTGNNTNSSSPTNFFAVPGYDLCTGWGTPVGQELINALEPLISVSLPASATEGNGVLTNAGQIHLWTNAMTNLTVTLTSSDTNSITVPPTVTVLSNQNSATFNLTIIDDSLLNGTRTPTISAYAPGFGIGNAAMFVFDNETATLSVSFPGTVTEGDGIVAGTIYSSAAPAVDIPVSLSSSDTTEIQVPASIVLPAGQTSVNFNATVLDDNQIDGPQSVTITAHVRNWTDGTANVTVLDNENLNLTVTLPPNVNENAGVVTNAGAVSISGTLTTNLPISLISSDTNRLRVPLAITILAGQVSASFNLIPVDNAVADGNELIAITASAPSFTNGTNSILVIDDETPPTPSNPRPTDLAIDVPANTNLSWSVGPGGEFVQNGGFETGTFTNWIKQNTGGGDFVINDGTYQPPGAQEGPTAPFAGNYSVVSEQSGPSTHTLYQDVAIPVTANSAVLQWTDRIRNFASQFTASQYFRVQILTTNNTLLANAFATQPGFPLLNDWTTRTFNLEPYAGQTVRIAFVESDSLFYFNVHLDNISVQVSSSASGVSNDVYFGTTPTPGPAQRQGTTTNTSWPLPLLSPLTTYYWQIVSHKTGTSAGPVWQFTTAGPDHFAWSPIAALQFTNTPFAVTVTALDSFNNIVTNFTGPVLLYSTPPNTVIPDTSGIFSNGVWSGTIILTDRATNAVLIADDGNGDIGTSNPFGIAPVAMPPVIVTQPDDQTAPMGTTATFTVEADGTPFLHYQWHFNDTNDIPGATNSVLVLTNVTSTNEGNYSVTVTNQFGFVVSSDAALGVILLDHFAWAQVAPPQFVNAPFVVTIMAQDVTNNTFTNFTGTVSLNCTNGAPMSPVISGSFTQGVWTGTVAVSQAVSNCVLRASDNAGHIGFSYPFDVVNLPRLSTSKLGNSLTLSWPAAPSDFILQSSYSLSPANWEPYEAFPTLSNNIYYQAIPFTETNQFFRLQYSPP